MKQVLCTLDLQDYETDSQPVKPTPLLLRLVEKIGGQVDVNPQCGDDSTYHGATGIQGVADYESD